MSEARLAAAVMLGSLVGRRVVLLGRSVVAAFGFRFGEWMAWGSAPAGGGEVWWSALPHPSGVSRWWNDRGNVERARGFMRALAGKG